MDTPSPSAGSHAPRAMPPYPHSCHSELSPSPALADQNQRRIGEGSLKRAFFGDSDDELTDLSDSDADEEDKTGYENGVQGDDESEEDSRPARKRVKTKPLAKTKVISKGEAGTNKKPANSKKAKAGAKPKNVQREKKLPKVDPVDGRLIAHRPEWQDMPDWKGKEGSPLMGMPADILDKCFGLDQDLAVSPHTGCLLQMRV